MRGGSEVDYSNGMSYGTLAKDGVGGNRCLSPLVGTC